MWLKSDKNYGWFAWTLMYIYDNISLNCYKENQNSHFILDTFLLQIIPHYLTNIWNKVVKYYTARKAQNDDKIRRIKYATCMTDN